MFAASDRLQRHQGVATILIGWGILSTVCILTDSHAISLISLVVQQYFGSNS
jgi:hypothetical protein